ncbi:energy transducer TonB [Pseudomonas sp. DTU_2021_1001937_2_SI_NGA_ILE_001]|uniref:energy transducer TonB n=1 Tax=Pseudomonas sp. DTU_2021_1001937_2_SI_NGA_ILE_001 TaxID=3077589 RepID=UPI0028FC0D21|nr:energy transducer TonB [Pseudomonas sp. DTU_2021_1001937_2_SI_NGA_ILE_001]WNW11835.1 energy transducer TonB [Pseudomonas sp. DTU_2021_1001937_2_SI_NGA_ILE_001]
MNDAVRMKAVPAPLPDERPVAWQGIPFKPNTSRPGGLGKPQVVLLIAASVLIHGAVWWYMQTAKAEVPEVAPQVPEMTIELSSPTPPAPEPPPPEPPPPPPPPEPEQPVEDPDAVEPPPKQIEKPKVEKPKPVKKPEPVKKPTPPAPPKPLAAPAPAAPPAPPAPAPAPAPPAPAAPVKESAAVSGLASLGNPPPEYPGLALRRNWEGRVVLRIKVLPNGRAGAVEVTKSSGKPVLDEAAVEAVRNWKFIPAKRGDTPIEGFATQTIDFKLPE